MPGYGLIQSMEWVGEDWNERKRERASLRKKGVNLFLKQHYYQSVWPSICIIQSPKDYQKEEGAGYEQIRTSTTNQPADCKVHNILSTYIILWYSLVHM